MRVPFLCKRFRFLFCPAQCTITFKYAHMCVRLRQHRQHRQRETNNSRINCIRNDNDNIFTICYQYASNTIRVVLIIISFVKLHSNSQYKWHACRVPLLIYTISLKHAPALKAVKPCGAVLAAFGLGPAATASPAVQRRTAAASLRPALTARLWRTERFPLFDMLNVRKNRNKFNQ